SSPRCGAPSLRPSSRTLSPISSSVCGSSEITSAPTSHTSWLETAQTRQRSCVTITSGRSVATSPASSAYSDSPPATAAFTAASISRPLNPFMPTFDALTTGSWETAGGQSHSSERPTRWVSRSSSPRISVALGSNETIRIVESYGRGSSGPRSGHASAVLPGGDVLREVADLEALPPGAELDEVADRDHP